MHKQWRCCSLALGRRYVLPGDGLVIPDFTTWGIYVVVRWLLNKIRRLFVVWWWGTWNSIGSVSTGNDRRWTDGGPNGLAVCKIDVPIKCLFDNWLRSNDWYRDPSCDIQIDMLYSCYCCCIAGWYARHGRSLAHATACRNWAVIVPALQASGQFPSGFGASW